MVDRRVPARLLAVLGLLIALVAGGAQLAAAAQSPTSPTAPVVGAQAADDEDAVTITVYRGDGCPNCAQLEDFLDELVEEYPQVVVDDYEVWNSDENRDLFVQAGEDLGFEAGSVPTTVIEGRVWIGYSEPITTDITGAVERALAGEPVPPGVYGEPGTGTCDEDEFACSADETGAQVDVPLLGTVNLDDQNLLVSTLIIGFVDGVNPCSLWVISVLLTIVVRTASRRRVMAIGSTFLLVTAGMYALYIAAIYTVLDVVDSLGWIQLTVAVAAGIFGLVSVKDYFAFKKGLSFTIPDSAKPGIYKRMRAAAGHHSLVPALLATAALGVAVSLIETPCTAGFPVLWTGLLKANGASFAESALLFVAYMIPFLLDEMIVFGVAVYTMRATKLQEKHGEMLKLFAGVTMLALAAVMVINPAFMESPIKALLLFAGAFVLAAAVHAVTERVKARRAADRAVEQTPAS